MTIQGIAAGIPAPVSIGARRGGVRHFRVLDTGGIIWRGAVVPRGELVTVSTIGQHVTRWLAAGRVEAVDVTPGRVAGMCSECGCTWTQACPGGCSWADTERTLCSRCR